MQWCIDVGNTAVKVARLDGDAIGPVTRWPTGRDPASCMPELPLADAPAGTQVALVSVVPAWSEALRRRATSQRWQLLEVTARTIPIHVALPEPERVGADRLLGAWTARELHGAPALVVDVGTATTIDAVDVQGAFVGGAILPGPELALRSLGTTALLPSVSVERPSTAIGRDTLSALRAGVVLGHVEAIAGLLRRMTGELGGPDRPIVVLTGGGAEALGTIDGVDVTAPELLLHGLAMLAARVMVAP